MRKQQLCTYILSQLKQVTMDLTTVSSRVLFLTKPFRSPPRLVLSAHYSPAGGTRHPKSTIKLITQTAPRLVTSSIMVSGYTTQSALTYLFPKVQYSTIQLVHPLRQPSPTAIRLRFSPLPFTSLTSPVKSNESGLGFASHATTPNAFKATASSISPPGIGRPTSAEEV